MANLRCSVVALLVLALTATAEAQVRHASSTSQFELSATVQLDRADGAALARLERAKACLAQHQWDEAVETLRQVMESAEGKLYAVTPWRYVNLSDACQMQLAALPPEALKLYRQRVDPLAEKWCQDGIAQRDEKLLRNVVEQAFASSWGDKAIMALGEIRLEAGDFSAARWCWERILPVEAPPGEVNAWPGYPDSKLDPAAVRARLVLVSILEGSGDRARDELSQFVRLHAEARGRLGGRDVRYAAALAELLEQSALWPKTGPGPDWPTFAGSPSRNAVAPELIDVAGVEWRKRLLRVAGQPADPEPQGLAAAENPGLPPAWQPVISQGHVFAADQAEIFGLRADDGGPAWGGGGAAIYRLATDTPQAALVAEGTFGTPRYTLTVADGRLYAHMGLPITNPQSQAELPAAGGTIVCLDLRAEGKLLWKVAAEEGWAFDGAPVADGGRLFVSMRRSDIRPQAHVACLDATTGRMRWRRFISAAETPARGSLAEFTSTLLTLGGGTIYVNTNLGAVAALAATDGRLRWVSLYPRARQGDLRRLEAHWRRDLNPCLLDHGRLYVAPADSPRIYALDAATGQILWPGRRDDRPVQAPVQQPLDDVVHLLGVAGDLLIASGSRLYWIYTTGPRAGQIAHLWPQGDAKLDCGRGLLAGSYVLWPTRQKIYVFQQQTARLKREIELAPLGVQGGNLLVSDGRLLVATPGEIVLLGTSGGKKKEPSGEITVNQH